MNLAESQILLMGLEPSPYSMKVQSFLKYKNIPHKWISRSFKNEKLFQKHAKVQLIPLLFLPKGETMQDSTRIIERLEEESTGPNIHPEDEALWFISCLFEEFGDEWCNKLMFFQRWFYAADAKATGKRLAKELLGDQWWGPVVRPVVSRLAVRRMIPRLSYSGGNETNIPQLKESFIDLSSMLNTHFEKYPYLLGGRPCFGDFGLWCNLYQAWTDPTAGAYFEATAPALVAYVKRMLDPSVQGGFETIQTLKPTLAPIMKKEMATRFLPWMDSNYHAWHLGNEECSLTMNGTLFQQKAFKYQAVTLDELRRKFSTVSDNVVLKKLLEETNCLSFFDEI